VRALVAFGCLVAWTAAVAAQRNELIVQVVRPEFVPMAGVSISVTDVKSCVRGAAAIDPTVTRTADKSGMAKFENIGPGYFRIEVPKAGGWSQAIRCVRLGAFDSDFPTAYVQLQVKFIAPTTTVKH
jgi:hypothetical protein